MPGGADGEVYVAADPLQPEQRVAIKVLGAAASDAECRALLEVGSSMGGRMVAISDLGRTEEGEPFVVMPFYARRDLRRRRQALTGERPTSEVLALAAELNRIVGELHLRGHVHRNIKPENLLLRGVGGSGSGGPGDRPSALIGPDEELVLGEFVPIERRDGRTGLERWGGTEGYVAPELVAGDPPVPVPADVYSCSVVLVEMMFDVRPRPVADRRQSAFDPDVLGRMGPLAPVLRQGLSFDPADRQSSMTAWWQDLRSAVEPTEGVEAGAAGPAEAGRPVTMARPEARPLAARRRAVAVAVALGVVVVVVAAAAVAIGLVRAGDAAASGEAVGAAVPTRADDAAGSGVGTSDVAGTIGGPGTGLIVAESAVPAGSAPGPEVTVDAGGQAAAGPVATSAAAPVSGSSAPAGPTGSTAPAAAAEVAPAGGGGTNPTRVVNPTSSVPAETSAVSPTPTVGPSTVSGTVSSGRLLTSLAAGTASVDSVVRAASTACDSASTYAHGAKVTIAGVAHHVVRADAAAGAVKLEEGGYRLGVTGVGPFLIVGSAGADQLTGHTGDDVICGLDGDDDLNGKDGDNVLVGGAGSDGLKATAGTNVLIGDDSDRYLTGGTGEDWCSTVTNTHSTCEAAHRF